MGLQKVYDRSPVAFQHFMTTVAGYQRNRSRYGSVYWDYRRWLEDFDQWPLAEKLAFQNSELRRFVHFAQVESKFYHELFSSVDLTGINDVDDLMALPIIDKESLRSRAEDFYTLPRKEAIEGHTGGTTGKSLVIMLTYDDMMKRMAMLDHFKARVGFEHRKMRRATFNGKHLIPPRRNNRSFWRYNHACRQMMYSTFHITDEHLGRYIESLNKFKPHSLDGFFTSMVDVANYIERNDIRLTFQPVGIFPTSETITDAGRELLERVFKCRVYNQYASSEGAPFITECREGTLHIELASGVFEPAGNGEVLVTSFTTHGTPLIRYAIGDTMEFSDQTDCACGIQSTTVKEISGRKDDFLYRADGAKINAGNISNLFKNMPNALIRAQLIQNQKDAVHVLLEVDKGRYRDEYDELLKDEFIHKFGADTSMTIEHVDEIRREKSGKFRLIKNLVENA